MHKYPNSCKKSLKRRESSWNYSSSKRRLSTEWKFNKLPDRRMKLSLKNKEAPTTFTNSQRWTSRGKFLATPSFSILILKFQNCCSEMAICLAETQILRKISAPRKEKLKISKSSYRALKGLSRTCQRKVKSLWSPRIWRSKTK